VIVFAMEFVTEISQHLLWGSGPSEAADKYERMWSRHEQTLLSFSHCSPMKISLCVPFVWQFLTKWLPWVGDLYRLLVWPWRSKMWKHSQRQSRRMIVSADLTLGSPPSSSAWRSRYLWRMTSARFQTMSSCCLCPLRVYKFLFYKNPCCRDWKCRCGGIYRGSEGLWLHLPVGHMVHHHVAQSEEGNVGAGRPEIILKFSNIQLLWRRRTQSVAGSLTMYKSHVRPIGLWQWTH